jgi:acetyl/propionyl-CoA carboxylase alpha subunit
MNTRLQVEHPVTELVTGIDLVWAQLAQAQAPNQTILADIPTVRGHAIEVRIYAEDPSQGFMPTPGKIEKLRWPTGPGIRVDSGIEEGQTVGTSFDSMLAKLIVYAPNRDHAVARMRYALDETVILGMGTNQAYLRAIAQHPAVREGRVHTGFLGTEFADFAPVPSDAQLGLLAQLRSEGFARMGVGAGVASAGKGGTGAEIPSPYSVFGGKP